MGEVKPLSQAQRNEIARIWRICTDINVINGYQTKKSAQKDYAYCDRLERGLDK